MRRDEEEAAAFKKPDYPEEAPDFAFLVEAHHGLRPLLLAAVEAAEVDVCVAAGHVGGRRAEAGRCRRRRR